MAGSRSVTSVIPDTKTFMRLKLERRFDKAGNLRSQSHEVPDVLC
jgi:hypothetical protein